MFIYYLARDNLRQRLKFSGIDEIKFEYVYFLLHCSPHGTICGIISSEMVSALYPETPTAPSWIYVGRVVRFYVPVGCMICIADRHGCIFKGPVGRSLSAYPSYRSWN